MNRSPRPAANTLQTAVSVEAAGIEPAKGSPRFALRTLPLTLAIVAAVLLLSDVSKASVAHLREWTCIHHYEGSWDSDTGNGYYGGLQLDLAFQRTYAGWILAHHGTADHWKPATQMLVAERGWRRRGFSPWPNTARACGLLR